MNRLATLPMLLLLLPAAAPAQTDHRVEVLETYPPGPQVVLGPGEKFHVRVAWSTSSMTRIFLRPYRDGREVRALNSPSPRYDRGSGETAVWFSFAGPDDSVDEIRLFVGNSGHRLGARHAVDVRSGAVVARPPAPAWVAELESSVLEATGGPSAPPTNPDERWFNAFLPAVAGLALFGLAAPVWGVVRWRGRWRIAAAVPMAGMGLFAAFLLLTALFDPGSLGLLPLVVLLAAVPSSLFMVVLFLARRFTGADTKVTT